MKTGDPHLIQALGAEDESARLHAALEIGTRPDPGLLDAVIARCALEPDFYVRDMLTWSLTRFTPELVVPRLLAELRSGQAQARSQALHTLSKIRDPRSWSAITHSLLHDPDDEVARSAWRAAVVLVPDAERPALALELVSQLGRGDRNVQLSLSRALVALGESVVRPLLHQAIATGSAGVRAHAGATERLLLDPDSGSESAVNEARRRFALGRD